MTKTDTSLDWADLEADRINIYNNPEMEERFAHALREAFVKGASSRDADIAAAELRGRIAGLREAAVVAGTASETSRGAARRNEVFDYFVHDIIDAIQARADELEAGKP